MVINTNVCLITAIVEKERSEPVFSELEAAGITQHVNLTAGRRVTLRPRKSFLGLGTTGTTLLESPISIITFLVALEKEQAVLNLLAEKTKLTTPNRGAFFSQEVTLLMAHESCRENTAITISANASKMALDLMGICCYAQKGEGNLIGRIGLDTGCGIPYITYGIGSGLRNQLGLWRITIPADKEIIHLVTSSYNAEHIVSMMVDVGQLDRLGKGFIYLYPIKAGLMDTRLMVGHSAQMASLEQIVAAIDDLKEDTSWRRQEFSRNQLRRLTKRKYLKNLVNFTLICNEGWGHDLSIAASEAGASGATMTKIARYSGTGDEGNKASSAREMCEIIVAENKVEQILHAMEKRNAFGDESCGQVFIGAVSKAFTFMGKATGGR